MTIRVDPMSGLKVFDTRAAKASDAIAGKGYSIVTDEALKSLPELPPGSTFNAEEQAKYRAFKEARRGAADYMAMEGDFAKYLDDVYSAEPVPREALTDECEILVVGAGFGGLLLWQKLRQAGFTDVRFCEKGGDVGGTWYWNRYPGIACDVEAYSYLPTARRDRLCSGDEVRLGLRDPRVLPEDGRDIRLLRALPFPHDRGGNHVGTSPAGRWTVRTNRGDAMRARFRHPRERHTDDAQTRANRRHGKNSRAKRFTPRAGTIMSI